MGEPLSRVEAILQNILGADNILVPPGSQVEEILQAIYYNTEYEKNPKSRVAEILLAIKNKGIYDGPVLSRVEDILIHKLNNIPYTKHKKEDLSRVEQLLLDWLEQGGGEEIIEYTGTFPMTILANGEPLLDYIISGNTVQNGTPTPDNPIMPEGTGERTGNLFDYTKTDGIITNRYISQSGVIVNNNEYYLSYPIKVNVGETYTWRFNSNTANVHSAPTVGFYDSSDNLLSTAQHNISIRYFSFEVPTNCAYIRASVFTRSNAQQEAMLNLGSEALPYENFGYKIPISSANTTTPVYLGEVQSTRRIRKLVLDGTENWNEGTSNYYIFINVSGRGYGIPNSTALSTHTESGVVVNNNGSALFFKKSVFVHSSVADFKAYLAQQYANGTPVTVWYVLATEKTGIVNEPIMRIGDYADTLSMEQAGVDVPTNKKPTETVIDVPTSVKPSEGYIKYTEPTAGPAPKTQVLGTKNHEIYMTSNDEVYVLRR